MGEHLHRYAVMAVDYEEALAERSSIAALFNPNPLGRTTVSLRCEECGDPETRIVQGRWHQGIARG